MKLFCFLGPSGGGKSTIQHSLPVNIKFLTHYVTRKVRDKEVNGYHIRHTNKESFELMHKMGAIATRTEYAGNLYGAPAAAIKDIKNGKPYHATATIDSIVQFKELLGDENVIVLYIKPPSIEALRERMKARGESDELIENRIAHIFSAAELENEGYADYVIVNDDLEFTKNLVLGIIYNELYVKPYMKSQEDSKEGK